MTQNAQAGDLRTVTSADGSTIAYQAFGQGAPVILIGGAFNDRTTMLALAATLAPQFTAVVYDRRGRGDSTDDAKPGEFAVDREIEDLAALIDGLGGRASLFGRSSGGVLALEAATRGLPVEKVAVYEPAYIIASARPVPPADAFERLTDLVAKGDRDGAAGLFLEEQVGVPAQMVAGMRAGEGWGYMCAQAHSLPYDAAVCAVGGGFPAERLAALRTPTLAVHGDQTYGYLQASTEAVADTVPDARHVVLAGEDHGVLAHPEALLPALTDFLA
jgi:pimeloyl-ACP methyl ester carboxylesterase